MSHTHVVEILYREPTYEMSSSGAQRTLLLDLRFPAHSSVAAVQQALEQFERTAAESGVSWIRTVVEIRLRPAAPGEPEVDPTTGDRFSSGLDSETSFAGWAEPIDLAGDSGRDRGGHRCSAPCLRLLRSWRERAKARKELEQRRREEKGSSNKGAFANGISTSARPHGRPGPQEPRSGQNRPPEGA